MRRIAVAILTVCVFGSVASAATMPTVTVESKVFSQGPAVDSFFDVFIDINAADPPAQTISGFQVAVTNTSGGALTFGAPTNTADTTKGPARAQALGTNNWTTPISSSDPNSATHASALNFMNSGSSTFVDDQGLIRIPFTIPANTPAGKYNIHIITEAQDGALGTILSDVEGSSIPTNYADGTITITPEPAVLSLAVFAGVPLLRRRTK